MAPANQDAVEYDEVIKIFDIRENSANKEGRYVLLEANLLKVVANIPAGAQVAIISAIGPMRGGKSFLLNLLLAYANDLQNPTTSDEWLEACNWRSDPKINEGRFPCKQQKERVTRGIWLSTKPVANEDNVVTFLMDTQGLFDDDATPEDNTVLFTLTAALSSIVIFNIRNQVLSDALEKLQSFTDFGKKTRESNSLKEGESLFRDLIFLVRDWEHEDTFGFDSKKRSEDSTYGPYLARKFGVSHQRSAVFDEVRTELRKAFTHIDCFFLPPPGKDTIRGRFGRYDDDFKTHVLDFFNYLLNKPKPISVNGYMVTVDSLVPAFWTFSKRFKVESFWNEPMNLVSCRRELRQLKVMKKVDAHYKEGMTSLVRDKPYIKPENLRECHERLKRTTVEKFLASYTETDKENWAEQLRNDIDSAFEKFRFENDSKYSFFSLKHGMAVYGASPVVGAAIETAALSLAVPVVGEIMAAALALGTAWKIYSAQKAAIESDDQGAFIRLGEQLEKPVPDEFITDHVPDSAKPPPLISSPHPPSPDVLIFIIGLSAVLLALSSMFGIGTMFSFINTLLSSLLYFVAVFGLAFFLYLRYQYGGQEALQKITIWGLGLLNSGARFLAQLAVSRATGA